jgi:FtsH-binding integral membrane protein
MNQRARDTIAWMLLAAGLMLGSAVLLVVMAFTHRAYGVLWWTAWAIWLAGYGLWMFVRFRLRRLMQSSEYDPEQDDPRIAAARWHREQRRNR